MKSPEKYIRKAFGDAISGVSYSGDLIPISDSFSDEVIGRNQIILSSLERFNNDDKTSFNGNYTLTIEVVTKSKNSANKLIADEISDQVTQRLQPTRKTTGIVINPAFQIVNISLDSSGYIEEETKANFIVRKLLRYRFMIVQI